MTTTRVLLTALAVFYLSSCVTIGRHEELEGRVIAMEKFKRDTEQLLKRDVKRLENLNKKLKEASANLRKHGASLAAKVDGQGDEARALKGRIEELDYLAGRMSAQLEIIKRFMDERFGLSVAALPADIPTEPLAMLDYGRKRLDAGQYDVARAVLRRFLSQHPSHPKTARAQLMVGEAYHRQKRFQQALREYHAAFKPFSSVPASKAPPEASEALWLAAKALDDGGQCNKALKMYKYLGQKFRKTPLGDKARGIGKTRKCR